MISPSSWEISPRSLLLVPFKYFFVVGLLFMAFLGLEFDVYSTDDSTLEMFVPDPESVDTDDDANESVGMTVPHLEDPRSITDQLGLSWHLDDDTRE